MIGQIPAKFDMDVPELFALRENYPDPLDLAVAAFRFGFYQGQRAAEERMKTLPEEIKRKDDYRRAIIATVYKIKNIVSLRIIYQISLLFWKCFDGEPYKEVPQADRDRMSTISTIMRMRHERHLRSIKTFANTLDNR